MSNNNSEAELKARIAFEYCPKLLYLTLRLDHFCEYNLRKVLSFHR